MQTTAESLHLCHNNHNKLSPFSMLKALSTFRSRSRSLLFPARFDHALVSQMFLNRQQAMLPPEVKLSDSEIFDDTEWSPSIVSKLNEFIYDKPVH